MARAFPSGVHYGVSVFLQYPKFITKYKTSPKNFAWENALAYLHDEEEKRLSDFKKNVYVEPRSLEYEC
jgi:hypothetical protein